ncbi:outer membrane protein assembly factor BamA [Rhodoblastus acidophilus]|uniref:Outer membrane protein assembly factor BamA n=1 Tax=Candidatus Rhodoblastus alkanivorans TaxID=2954117 RepID=A0ABS9Z6C9_9HYPH|nr:outer membrane protein assembly factor BamA [Candidatus Rhodoblastus alkanivorans]MCI4680439.1 outer membrane protein assembly factor BamA [Candidatus Rhodoblastus alkanivorans]MCI4683198.1 outer membrane protein assembly factor BamA [Candidatus Rhodoblastus alkanivorans]
MVGSLTAPTRALAENIVVEGNHRVDSETIRSYFVGGDSNDAIKKLYSTGYFSDVQVNRRGGTLVVRVVENSTMINHVVFVGNSKVKSEDLQKEVQLKSRGAYSQAVADADVQRILDVYRRAGRNAATVSVRTVQVPNGTVDVVFDVNEGDKTGIKEIRFVGNHAYSDGKLKGLMESTEMNLLSFFKTSDVYDPDRLAKDAEAIRRYYLKNGYADFRIIGVDPVYDPAAGGYVVTISMEEGSVYRVSAVRIDSQIPGLSDGVLKSALDIHAGDIYDGDAVQNTTVRLTKEVQKLGYAFAQVRPTGDKDPANHTVSIGFVIEQGPRVYVERINIRGNTATRDYVIRREFDIGEGDPYNKVLIDRAERRLNALGFFKKVKVTNEPGSAPDRVILDVDVEEQSTGSFAISGGYSTVQGFIAEVSVTQSNFLGRGEYIRGSVSAGQYSSGVELNYTEPFFMDNRLAAGFDLYSKMTMASTWAYYSNWVTGGTLRLGIPLTDDLSIAPRYTLYNSQLTVPNNSSEPFNDCTYPLWVTPPYNGFPVSPVNSCLTNGEASLALKQAVGNWLTSMIGYTLSYNTVDNPRDPHSGIRAELKQDFAGVGGNSNFLRSTVDIRGYHNLYFDNVVGLVHLQAGNLVKTGNSELRVVDNFNLGPSLVRGFAPGGIGPRDITNATTNNNGNALGGTDYWGASLEAQFPIPYLPKDIGLKGAVYADAGSLWNYQGMTNFGTYLGYSAAQASSCTYMNNYNPNGSSKVTFINGWPVQQQPCIAVGSNNMIVRSSVGLGLIWASPMGPIRFNYSFVLSKSQYDIEQQFSFSGGTTF